MLIRKRTATLLAGSAAMLMFTATNAQAASYTLVNSTASRATLYTTLSETTSNGTKLVFNGTVYDNANDGRCAYVLVTIDKAGAPDSSSRYSSTTCGSGTQKAYSGTILEYPAATYDTNRAVSFKTCVEGGTCSSSVTISLQ